MESTFPLTYIGTDYSYPVDSDVADVVVATNVMEHVRKPWVWMRELARISEVLRLPVERPYDTVTIGRK